MPFVFVHGVNTRKDVDYDRAEKRRNAFLREVVAPAAGISPKSTIRSPYWGNDGVKFWRNLEVVPGKGVEAFGSNDKLPPSIGIAVADKVVLENDSIEAVARKAPDVVIDLLWDYAAAGASRDEQFDELAASYRKAIEKLEADGGRAWLGTTKSADLADDVFSEVRPAQVDEQFGGGGLFSMLTEASKRIALKPADIVAAGAIALARKPLTHTIGTFVGDAFQYLAERGDGTAPGPIAKTVLDALLEARKEATALGEPLIVICHSFGGEIVYDILTHYAQDMGLELDVWVTVGSQVGLFEEMSLLWASEGRTKPRGAFGGEAIASPASAKRWINIADGNDIFGFLVLPVFTGATAGSVSDFLYDTGYPIAGAHSGYFEWPSFYKRLAHRLKSK